MIKGIGIDALDLARVKEILENKPRFPQRVLTPAEFQQFSQLPPHRQVEYLAGRFCCKEAFAKAWGTGIGKGVGFQEIEILSNELGAPVVTQSPYKTGQVFVTITHTATVAMAQILLEGE
ncbi:holo-[acyl-carrier protein] synthase [Enterococcus sp. PF1-24]|uniref:holo-ACP synthase n=1 Tax=unclassified Enterococcus TaxID=2608891 RepID=UPI0024748EEF|nr:MULTISPECIES: holo-ACP synthase [unclassified Enterococcus]MDH6364881.1 holo-[acyl-carrier protein] synthase [Enterococcus sp. PFB1-1]MDH6401982.1 holo-[acyl-carrier protein] synthase [Enterococcus sp. PF1-24]